MRPVVLHHLMIALFACLSSLSIIHPTPSTSLSSSVFRRSPSITSIGSQLLPSFSTSSSNNLPSPSRSTASIKENVATSSSSTTYIMAYKMCTLIFEIFTSLCLLSGTCYDTILSVISDVKGEQYRFERLVQALHDLGILQRSKYSDEQQELVIYDCIASSLHFFNAIVQTPQLIETRDSLRTELERRGLEDFLKRLEVKRNVLPENLKAQMDSYFNQKKFDQEKIQVLENTKRQSILQL
ncbi:hypothetical protein EDC94DRAFT_293974 [Helicostylum pulchrum]|nr:hypothetical protein EDC94DRAFT_293974 [Helicostylum pulchrum]